MAGALLNLAAPLIVPETGPGQLDRTVAANFERFDGLEPLDNPAGNQQLVYYPGGPRPGQSAPTPDVYTPGGIPGLTNTLGGQPLPVHDWRFRVQGYTPARFAQTIQHRLGAGQNNQGVAQTVALADITNNPPQPDSLQTIMGIYG